jgi:hypothetical protein
MLDQTASTIVNQGRKPFFKVSGRPMHDGAHVMDLEKRQERTGASNTERDRLAAVIDELVEATREPYEVGCEFLAGARSARAGHATRPAIAQEALAMVRDALDLDHFAKR